MHRHGNPPGLSAEQQQIPPFLVHEKIFLMKIRQRALMWRTQCVLFFCLPKWRTFCLCSAFFMLHNRNEEKHSPLSSLPSFDDVTNLLFICMQRFASIHSIVELKAAWVRKWRLLLVIDDYKVICIRSEWRGDNCIIQYPFECKLDSFEKGFCAIKLLVKAGNGSFFDW